MTADDPQIGKIIRTAFEQQMNAEQKSIDTLNQTLSSNSIINAQENANAELLAARKNFDNEVTNYYKSTMLIGEKIVAQTHVQFNTSILKVSVIWSLRYLSSLSVISG